MELRVLRYFLTVAREESITAAAKFLHLTQPTLSRQLKELEEELGVKLFTRGKRKIILTDEGRLLRKRAEEIDDLVQKTHTEVLASAREVSGDIYIGGGETRGMRLIAQAIKDLQSDYPQIRVHIISGNADEVTDKLDQGLLDFGLLIQPYDISRYESIRLPAIDTWGVLMRKDNPLAIKETIKPSDLWDKPLICSRQRLVYGDIGRWIQKSIEELNLIATYNLVYNASLMVEEGLGYALTLDKLINTAGDSPLCFRPLEPTLVVNLDLVWKKYQVFSKAAQIFLERIQEKLSCHSYPRLAV